jgi:hypothetical protein
MEANIDNLNCYPIHLLKSSFDGSECDGPDSPKRLYNRKPSAHFAKTEEELVSFRYDI